MCARAIVPASTAMPNGGPQVTRLVMVPGIAPVKVGVIWAARSFASCYRSIERESRTGKELVAPSDSHSAGAARAPSSSVGHDDRELFRREVEVSRIECQQRRRTGLRRTRGDDRVVDATASDALFRDARERGNMLRRGQVMTCRTARS